MIMAVPFELEWMGGVAEHHFRKARPEPDLPWGTLDVGKYPPRLIEAARDSWTQIAITEYRAVVAFSEVVRSLVEALAPLDLIGMASDFIADEVLHVELASRMAMELGGAVAKAIDPEHFSLRPSRSLTPLQRANEIVLQVGCVAEIFSGGTAAGNLRVAAHPLARGVFARILSDEGRHQRFGSLYFEWASERLDDDERQRLSQVATHAIEAHRRSWTRRTSKVTDGVTEEGYTLTDLHELGWLQSEEAVPLARQVVLNDVLPPLAALGIILSEEDRDRLFA